MKRSVYIVLLVLISSLNAISQTYTEYYFKFNIQDKKELDILTEIISIDNVRGFEVFAYANQQEFNEFELLDYKIELLEKEAPKSLTMATSVAEMANWDRYPTYEVYRQMMKNFEADYPTICKLDSFGTTNNGRQLYALKISDNIDTEEDEPEFFYTSTMHGDETTGYILLLRLADSLLSQYGSEPYITNLVNEIEIYINPNANPDGTYNGGNQTVSGAIRSNGYADINRDFPDPRLGLRPPYQPETQAMMDYANDHNFVMSANFHGGVEVMNYPWDTWYYSTNPHSDTDWFEKVCTNYVDTARTVTPTYMSSLYADGVTHGATWYLIAGGRQDYMNFWHQCREVTIEVSGTKLLATESLNYYWNINKRSLLYYLNECLLGVRGIVTNNEGDPLDAMIWIEDHDNFNDSSMVYTDPDIGDYHRLIETGTYSITASAKGYVSQTVENIVITQANTTLLNFILSTDSILLNIDPFIIEDTLFFDQVKYHEIVISNDSSASTTSYNIEVENAVENTWLELNKSTAILTGKNNDTTKVTINADLLLAGDFSTNILITSADSHIDTIPVDIRVNDTINFNDVLPDEIHDTLYNNHSNKHNIIVSYEGPATHAVYDIAVENSLENTWVELDKSTAIIYANQNDTAFATINPKLLAAGEYSANILLTDDGSNIDTIPVNIIVDDSISLKVEYETILDTLFNNQSKTHNIIISNDGPATHALYDIEIENEIEDFWLELNKNTGTVLGSENDTAFVTINPNLLDSGEYSANILLTTNGENIDTIPVNIIINDSILFKVEPEAIFDTLFYNEAKTHKIIVSNDASATHAFYEIEVENEIEDFWLELNKNAGIVLSSTNDTTFVNINANLLDAGYYSANLILSSKDIGFDTIPINVLIKDTISTLIDPETIIDTLWAGDVKNYDIIIKNDGLLSINYTIQIDEAGSNDWVSLDKSVGNLIITKSDTIKATVVTANHSFGNLSCDIIVQKENSTNDTIPVQIFVKDTIASEIYPISIRDTLDSELSKQYPIVIKNLGSKNLEYTTSLIFLDKSDMWINQNKFEGTILPEFTDTILITVNTTDLSTGDYVSYLTIFENNGKNTYIPIEIFVNKIQSIGNKPTIDYFQVYPNPFNENLNIQIIPTAYKNIVLRVFNINGSSLFTKEIDLFNNQKNTISLNNYLNFIQIPKGIYFIQISTQDFQLTKKVIKH